MKKALYIIAVSFTITALAGCITVKKTVRERADQDVSGNRGYMEGAVPEAPEGGKKTREYVDIKIEVPTWQEFKKGRIKTKEEMPADESEFTEEGNRGIIMGSVPAKVEQVEPLPLSRPGKRTIFSPQLPSEPASSAAQTYVVQKGDTLSHIAHRFYNKASKWTLIYEANMDKIKDPKRIKPGLELIIPDLEEESEYIK